MSGMRRLGVEIRGGERKGGVVKWERKGDLCEGEECQLYGHVCTPPALPGAVLISTVMGISLCPVFCTINITVPSSSFTV